MDDFLTVDQEDSLLAELAKLEDYNIYWIEEPLSSTEQIIQELIKNVSVSLGMDFESLIPAALQPVSKQLVQDSNLLTSFNDPRGQYAFCLNCQVE